jgi:putative copper export protein
VIAVVPPDASPIDDFLDETSGAAATLRWEGIGVGLGVAGTIVAVGLVTLLAVAHCGRLEEIRRLLRLVMAAGALLVVGSVVETAAAAEALGTSWAVALTDGSVVSAMLRCMAGLFVLLGFVDETVSIGGLPGVPRSVAGAPDGSDRRWVPGAAAAFGFAGVGLAVASFAFDGHTVTEGPRLVHAAVSVVHVGAAGVWGGGVLGLGVVALASGSESIRPTFDRFSPVATAVLGPVLVTGVVMAVFVLDTPGDLVGTSWGQVLLVKSTVVAVAMVLGARHHRLATARRDPGRPRGVEIRGSILAEAVSIVAVVIAAGVLVRSSTL